jgi:hypothetical protein
MNNADNHFSDPDKALDALLKKRAVRPSADFTARTLARISAEEDVTDAFIDEMLAKRPVKPRQDFTSRTLARITRHDHITAFLRPMLAAAASIAVSISGIWVYENATVPPAAGEPVAKSNVDLDEIRDLAAALTDAAPLLDPRAVDTLALTYGE